MSPQETLRLVSVQRQPRRLGQQLLHAPLQPDSTFFLCLVCLWVRFLWVCGPPSKRGRARAQSGSMTRPPARRRGWVHVAPWGDPAAGLLRGLGVRRGPPEPEQSLCIVHPRILGPSLGWGGSSYPSNVGASLSPSRGRVGSSSALSPVIEDGVRRSLDGGSDVETKGRSPLVAPRPAVWDPGILRSRPLRGASRGDEAMG